MDENILVDCTIQRLVLIRNDIRVGVLHTLHGYSPGTEDNEAIEIVGVSILWLARLDTWVGTVVECLTKKKSWPNTAEALC